MTLPTNIFNSIEQLTEYFGPEDLLEGRFDNDVDDNPIYIGYSPIPNADPALPVWYIQKIIYVGAAIVRKQIPDDGVSFTYAWDLRTTYFS